MTDYARTLAALGGLEGSCLTVDHARCLLARNRNTHCARCVEACTSGCISYDGEVLAVDSALCVGCGTCATACPSGAISPRKPDDSELLAQMAEKVCDAGVSRNAVVIACADALSRLADAERACQAVAVTCLSRVDESLLVHAAADGVDEIAMVRGKCEACPHRTCVSVTEDVVRSVRSLLSTWGGETRIDVIETIPEWAFIEVGEFSASGVNREGEEPPSLAECGCSAEREHTFARVDASGHLPQYISERHSTVLGSLERISSPDEDVVVDSRLWGRVKIDVDTCLSCRMCTTFCTTGALTWFSENGSIGVDHVPSLCVQCRCCESICPAEALSVSSMVSVGELRRGLSTRFVMDPAKQLPKREHRTMHRMRDVLKTPMVFD